MLEDIVRVTAHTTAASRAMLDGLRTHGFGDRGGVPPVRKQSAFIEK